MMAIFGFTSFQFSYEPVSYNLRLYGWPENLKSSRAGCVIVDEGATADDEPSASVVIRLSREDKHMYLIVHSTLSEG